MLIPIGAALEVRDRVAGAVDELATVASSRSALDRRLKRFERRGGSARTRLEREVRQTRARIEREVRDGRVRLERRAGDARRDLERQRAEVRRAVDMNVEALQGRVAPVRDRVAPVRSRVEDVVQNSVNTGMKLVGDAQGRISQAV